MKTAARLVWLAAFILFGASPGYAQSNLLERLETIAQTAKGKVGFAAELIETGETFQLHPTDRFPMQSVYKLPIAMAVLDQVDRGTLRLDQVVAVTTNDFISPRQHSPIRDAHPLGTELTVSNLLQEMVSESDGTACDVLLKQLHGFAPVNQYLHQIGVTNLVVATTEKEMGLDELAQYRSWSAPTGMVALLKQLHAGRALSTNSRALLLRWMTASPTGPHRIRGLLPPNTPVAHKTGSSGTVNGLARATNDAGIITLPDGRHLAIAVFVSDATANEATREAVIAGITRALWDHWLK